MTTPTHTPEQWAEVLESLARNKALPSLWPEDCFAIAALLRAQADAQAEQEAEVGRLRETVARVEELARDWQNQAWANDAAGAPRGAADKAISPTLKVCVYRLNKVLIPAQEAPQ